jgi:amino acid adenylation domain-containing protein
MIGYFLNTLVLRTDLSGHPTFQQLLQRVREVTMGAYAHQDIPFEQLVETLRPKQRLGMNPFFDVMFDLDPPLSNLDMDWTFSQLDIQTDTAKFALTLELDDRPEGLIGRIEYNTDLFDEDTIQRMIGHYHTLLDGIVADPKQAISHLPLLTPQEKQQFIEWNNTQTDYPADLCIHHLFEQQVEKNPDAIALVFEGKQLTYGELNRSANQVAHYLMISGVEAETLVGICVERSMEMIIGLLGILKAGGAYVPLDPSYPEERLAFMLEDAQVSILLTQTGAIENLPTQLTSTIYLDTDWKKISHFNQENPSAEVTSENLAYVIYTSGSTGQPKGVAIPHKAINRLVSNTNYIHLDAFSVVAQASNFSFDAATFEIWGTLANGAKLVKVPKNIVLSPKDFATYIGTQGINVLFLTTALFNQIAQIIPWAFNSIHTLLFGGEAVEPKWVKEVFKHNISHQLLHVYGPTETTTFASWYLIQDIPENATTIPIGSPISNTQLYVLDANLQQVPIGIIGELYIGGVGLARGYLNCPELNAQKFIVNPFSDNSNSRLYKTGDLVRYRSDGHLEFLGRLDHQIKLRGFRIELPEIEAVLSQHASIEEVVVLAREDIGFDKRLIAYFIAKSQQSVSSGVLRRFLQNKLPDYMIPSAFLQLEALPLTPNGKIDREALPEPKQASAILESAYIAPQTEIEEKIETILKSVLRVDKIGIQDNFFELGAHSLLLVQAQEKLQRTLDREVPVLALFQYPTISSLADYLESSLTVQNEAVFQEEFDERAAKIKEARQQRRKKRR